VAMDATVAEEQGDRDELLDERLRLLTLLAMWCHRLRHGAALATLDPAAPCHDVRKAIPAFVELCELALERGDLELALRMETYSRACALRYRTTGHRLYPDPQNSGAQLTAPPYTSIGGGQIRPDRAGNADFLRDLAASPFRHPALIARFADLRWEAGRYAADARVAFAAYLALDARAGDDMVARATFLDRATELATHRETGLGASERRQVIRRVFAALRALVWDGKARNGLSIRILLGAAERLATHDGAPARLRAILPALLEPAIASFAASADPNTETLHYELLRLGVGLADRHGDDRARSLARSRVARQCEATVRHLAPTRPLEALAALQRAIFWAGQAGDRALLEHLGRLSVPLVDAARAGIVPRRFDLAVPQPFHPVPRIAALLALPVEGALAAIGAGGQLLSIVAPMRATIAGLRPKLVSLTLPTLTVATGRILGATGGADGDGAGTLDDQEVSLYVANRDFGMLIVGGYLDSAEERGDLDADVLFAFLARGPLLGGAPALTGSPALLRAGLERYFDGDYASAVHLLVPQLEATLRHLAHLVGGPIVSTRQGTTQALTIGTVLDDPDVGALLGEDRAAFLRTLLVDPRAENLRNDVAHGLIDAAQCDRAMAQRVLAAFLLLHPVAAQAAAPVAIAQSATPHPAPVPSATSTVAMPTPTSAAAPSGTGPSPMSSPIAGGDGSTATS